MMYTVCNRHPLFEMCMLFVGTSIIHHSTEGIFILCNIWDLLIYSNYLILQKLLLFPFPGKVFRIRILQTDLRKRSARRMPSGSSLLLSEAMSE